MNSVTISGWLQGDAEERVTSRGRRLLAFDLLIDGPPDHPVYVSVSYFIECGGGDLRAGTKVLVTGALKTTKSATLFIGAHDVGILAAGELVSRNGR